MGQVVNLLVQSDPNKSVDENSAALINMYLAGNTNQGKYDLNAMPTPGLTVFSTIASPVRALYEEHGVTYAVGGNTFYSIASNGSAIALGTLNTSSGFAKIRGINSELLIIDGSNGYVYNITNNSFQTLASTTYTSSIIMTASGQNYSLANVIILSPVGTGAAGTATLSGGQVTDVMLTANGSGYTTPPNVYFATTSGSGATATVGLSGSSISTINITNGGNSYVAPSVIIVDSTGHGATATCTVVSGAVTSVHVVSGGTGYTSPTIYFYDLGGSGASGTVSTTGGAGSSIVTGVTINNGGSSYVNPAVTFTDVTGSGASATVQSSNGVITGVTITGGGANYTAPVAVFTDLNGTGATATAYTTTSSFNNNVIDIEAQDEFGIAAGFNTQEWFITSVSDLTTWPALSFASVTGNQNNLVALSTLHREIWLFGEQTTEIWYNAGNQFFTFARRTDVYIEMGCAAKQSLALGDNTLFLLAQSRNGGIYVARMSGYTPQVISTDAINYQLSTYNTISDAIGFIYYQEGHAFYILTFPTQGVTWVYDITTQTWSQRQSLVNSSQTRWIPSCFTYCYNKQLVGGFNSGNVYQLDMTNYTENGSAITRTIQTHPWYETGNQTYVDRLQIDFDTTPGAQLSQVNLYVSRDGGNTFGSAKPAFPVQTSDGQWRCYWPRLGRARTWVFKIQTALANKFIVLGAWALIRGGDN